MTRLGNFWIILRDHLHVHRFRRFGKHCRTLGPRGKALLRGARPLVPLGVVLGFIFEFVANIIYSFDLGLVAAMGVQSYRILSRAPIARGIAWAVFGVAGGIVYGIVGQSGKKTKYGIIGGAIGAAIGGMIFDPISMMTKAPLQPRRRLRSRRPRHRRRHGLRRKRTERPLALRHLRPLAGKQFILYKALTTIGSLQSSDIYLFKDANIAPQHAAIAINGSRVQLQAQGLTYVGGNSIQARVLQDGDLVQIGKYAFRYKEKHRA